MKKRGNGPNLALSIERCISVFEDLPASAYSQRKEDEEGPNFDVSDSGLVKEVVISLTELIDDR